MAAGLEGRRRVVPDDLARDSSTASSGAGDVAGGDGDLDLGRQQAGARPAVPGLLGDGGVDRAEPPP